MAITAAKYVSSDEYRIEYQVDGGPEWIHIKGFDHPDRAAVLAAIPSPTPHVKPLITNQQRRDNEITEQFWKRVGAHFGVSPARAMTYIAINGAPAAVQAYWAKAEALMDGPDVNITTIEDNGSWE